MRRRQPEAKYGRPRLPAPGPRKVGRRFGCSRGSRQNRPPTLSQPLALRLPAIQPSQLVRGPRRIARQPIRRLPSPRRRTIRATSRRPRRPHGRRPRRQHVRARRHLNRQPRPPGLGPRSSRRMGMRAPGLLCQDIRHSREALPPPGQGLAPAFPIGCRIRANFSRRAASRPHLQRQRPSVSRPSVPLTTPRSPALAPRSIPKRTWRTIRSKKQAAVRGEAVF